MEKKSWEQLAATVATNILDLYLMPTEQCNFCCVYCYEELHLSRMSILIIKGIKEFIKARLPDLKQLRISWLGGEPLTASDIVLDVSQYAKDLMSDNFCDYNFSISTNGYLLDVRKFIMLINAGITSYQILLDGPSGRHDFIHKHKNTKGTLARIWYNLNQIKQLYHDFEIILRVQVTPENYRVIVDFINQIKFYFKNDNRFKIFFKVQENITGPNAGMFSILGNKTKIEILERLTEYVGNDIAIHSMTKDERAYVCYAASQNAWVIRANGTLAKCTVALEDERNSIGRINPNGTLSLDQAKMQLWLRGLKNKDVISLTCPAYGLPSLKQIPIMVT